MTFARRKTPTVWIGNIALGGDYPVRIQSMTNTATADITGTVAQVIALAKAGSEIVRITVNDEEAAAAVPEIKSRLLALGYTTPLVGDFHFNGHQLLRKFPEMAAALDKLRINPGTVGRGKQHDPNFQTMCEVAVEMGKPVRIGVNWGSLDQGLLTELMDANAASAQPKTAHEVMLEACVESALRSYQFAQNYGLPPEKIVLSVKISNALDLWEVNRRLAEKTNAVIHLGLTEAGMGTKGIVASAAGLTPLLSAGIGDTIRVSLTPAPGEPRTREVETAKEILQSLGIRQFAPTVSSCPGCGRTTSSFFQELALSVSTKLNENMAEWKTQYPGVENLTVAVMGCVVNGPGESKHANIGISLPGTGENPKAPVYIDGELAKTLQGDRIAEEFMDLVLGYIQQKY